MSLRHSACAHPQTLPFVSKVLQSSMRLCLFLFRTTICSEHGNLEHWRVVWPLSQQFWAAFKHLKEALLQIPRSLLCDASPGPSAAHAPPGRRRDRGPPACVAAWGCLFSKQGRGVPGWGRMWGSNNDTVQSSQHLDKVKNKPSPSFFSSFLPFFLPFFLSFFLSFVLSFFRSFLSVYTSISPPVYFIHLSI